MKLGPCEPYDPKNADHNDPEKYVIEPGSAWNHTLLTTDAAAGLRDKFESKQDRIIFMLACLLHDIGKPTTTEETEEGRIISHGHEGEGAKIARQFLERLTDETDILDGVENLVHYHMVPTNLYESRAKDSAIRRLARKVDVPMLVALSMADKMGREGELDLKAERWLMKKYKALKLEDPETLDRRVKGRHLIQLGIQPGPEMGRILDKIYSAQLEGKFDTTEDGIKYATEQGLIRKGFFDWELDKSIPIKGFTRTRKGKFERVGPHTRTGKRAGKVPVDVGINFKDAKGEKISANRLAETMDRITFGAHLDVEAIKEALNKEGSVWSKTEVEISKLKRIDDPDVNVNFASETKGAVIVGRDGTIYDGRHRAAKAKKEGRITIEAYVPIKESLEKKTGKEAKDLKDEFEEKTSLLHTTYDRLASPPKTEKERQKELNRKKVDPETEDALRRLFAKSLREYIGKPNTEETQKEIRDLIFKAVQVKGFLRTRRGKSEWVRPHHREADEIKREIPEVGNRGISTKDIEDALEKVQRFHKGPGRSNEEITLSILSDLVETEDVKKYFGILNELIEDVNLRLKGIPYDIDDLKFRLLTQELTENMFDRDKMYPIPVYISLEGAKNTVGLLLHKDGKFEMFEGNDEASPATLDAVNHLLGVGEKKVTVWTSQPSEVVFKIKQGEIPKGIFVSPSREHAAGYWGEGRELISFKMPLKKVAQQSEVDWQVREKIEKSERLFIDLKKSRKGLVNLRKSLIEGKLIPYELKSGRVVWARIKNGKTIVKGLPGIVKMGDDVLLKSGTVRVTAIGKDGVTARSDTGRKVQVLYKDLKLSMRK